MRLSVLVLVLVAIAVATAGAGIALADEPTNETEEDEIPDGQPIDSNTIISDWSYSATSETFAIEIYAEEATRVQIMPSQDHPEGQGIFSWEEVRVAEGTSTVSIQADPINGEAQAILTTRDSRAEETGAWISTGQIDQNPLQHYDGTTGFLSGIGLAVLMSGVGAWWVVWRENDPVEVA